MFTIKTAMAKDKKEQQTEQEQAQGTVSPSAESIGEETNGIKAVNIPLSASNALSPEAGMQVGVAEDLTEEENVTDAYDPQKTKAQRTIKDDAEISDKVSKEKYEQLLNAFNEVLDNHTLDVAHKDLYRAKAGISLV
jgi:hypothetical protein